MSRPLMIAVLAAFAAAASLPALAGPDADKADNGLPGVERPQGAGATDAPLPEPDERLPVGSTPGSFKVGDWDVTISGSISYEIGTGGYRDGR
ncbi:MAG: hypothetical protein RH978_05085 [Roseitalea porphyridii]|uniref:hypothetical protein n=1 Tax=Roseitalea porphyridii TaxID=1852022 RepID=UPI0032EC2D19